MLEVAEYTSAAGKRQVEALLEDVGDRRAGAAGETLPVWI
jgi:hypothetical protein